MSFFINDALAASSTVVTTQTGSAVGSSFGSILMLIGFVLLFYILLWMPQQKRAKEHRNLVTNLAKGDEVITSGGLLGKINKIGDDFVTLMIAEGIEVKIQKPAIAASVPKGTFKSA